jgi:CBS domain-containing protein
MLEGSKLTASDIMTRDVATVFPHTSIRFVAKLFAERHISGAPVVSENGDLLGVVSEADLIRWHDGGSQKQAWWLHMLAEGFPLSPDYLDYVRSEQEKVRGVMSTELITVKPETPVSDVAALFAEKAIKRVPVVNGGKLVGIVSRGDLIKVLAES